MNNARKHSSSIEFIRSIFSFYILASWKPRLEYHMNWEQCLNAAAKCSFRTCMACPLWWVHYCYIIDSQYECGLYFYGCDLYRLCPVRTTNHTYHFMVLLTISATFCTRIPKVAESVHISIWMAMRRNRHSHYIHSLFHTSALPCSQYLFGLRDSHVRVYC